ncbi:Carboxy-terminal-processing protease [Geodia barretti]|uniref:Carboxy-terminal-processing protease n=1 Tax=Geodia barretti TaxID=519541 RepID=A0AA35R9Q4_GEOBA|nr:Carboxy-terminal-processing protease [Geodia barretti]
MAGALKDHERAYVIGQESYGKGSVQQVMRIEDDRAVKVTTSRYFTPDGTKIDGVGVLPHRITEPKLSEDDRKALETLVTSELLIRFALEHAEPTEAEIGELIAELRSSHPYLRGTDVVLEEQMIRRQLARSIARIHRKTRDLRSGQRSVDDRSGAVAAHRRGQRRLLSGRRQVRSSRQRRRRLQPGGLVGMTASAGATSDRHRSLP